MDKGIQVTLSSIPDFEEYIEEIKGLWDTKWITNMGVKHKELENRLLDFLSVENLSLFTNGHLALESIISAMNLTGEIITTPFTFASTTHAIVRNGLTPVFCDINEDDYTIDVDKIESLITEKTSAIVPIHVFGNVCNVDGIEKIAKKYKLKVIYDAAHCFGVELNGIGIGNFGDASIFSFHATKVFNTIEGGAVTFENKEINDILYKLKNFGIAGLENVDYIGGNAKMNEFQAAMGICNLRHYGTKLEKRKLVFNKYNDLLKNIEGIKLPIIQNNVKQNYSYYPVVFDGYKYTRDEVYEKLKKENIFARKYFFPLTSDFECYKGLFNNDTPVARYISERILCLPLYSELEIEEIHRICEIILK
ncbi:aminotransferase class I/II-fold pyridoxal phosphate-dependent enzyme [Clostridium tertium]|uniref:dTDP-4-amino-4,6-dideoxy-D-glucose transaminase n=1 Tax=Clostridium tertium TaxID=1559 RepID=A0A6N3EN85_9CLOT